MKSIKKPGLALLVVLLFSVSLADSASAQTMRRKDAAPAAAGDTATAPAATDAAPAAKPHKSKKAKKAAPAVVAPQTNIESHQH